MISAAKFRGAPGGALLLLALLASLGAIDLDSGLDATALGKGVEALEQGNTNSELKANSSKLLRDGWVRLRGIAEEKPETGDLKPEDRVQATREALTRLRARGLKTCVMLLWHRSAKREAQGDKRYLPDDLRQAYERGRWLRGTYGELVDAWEIDNEPDLGAARELTENYTAYLKAVYLGVKAGARDAQLGDKSSGLGGKNTNNTERLTHYGAEPPAPLVLMGALGLPPGPWLERFAANDGLAYTDGFNYHYYGYAEDFTGVYRQFEEAVKELSAKGEVQGAQRTNTEAAGALPLPLGALQRKALPIFLTEIGYGMLGKSAKDTKEGRLRQWHWFKSVGEQVDSLRIEAPMAFYLQPYLEYDTLEFGLTVPPEAATGLGVKSYELLGTTDTSWTAGGITYTSEDFADRTGAGSNPTQLSAPEPWMKHIGQRIGGNEVTPALAWWLAWRRPGQAPGVQQQTTAGALRAMSKEQRAKGFQAGTDSKERREAPLSVGSYQSGIPEPDHKEPLTNNSGRGSSRPWSVTTPAPSPVVIDFIAGAGLLPVKRYGAHFVLGRSERMEQGARSKEPESGAAKPTAESSQLKAGGSKLAAPASSEELAIHIRTQNGNLYEVYPTRLATADWQTYLEPQDNFTMSFYGRAGLPWRFKDNQPASLVLVLYPKQLPTTYEFRRMQLVELSAKSKAPRAVGLDVPTNNPEPLTNNRYGHGRIVLYNFSDRSITGKLVLPDILTADLTNGTDEKASGVSVPSGVKSVGSITLAPGERLEVEVGIKVASERYERTAARISFAPEDAAIPLAVFQTDFIRDIGGMSQAVVAELVRQRTEDGGRRTVTGNGQPVTDYKSLISTRAHATEEAPMVERGAGSTEQGANNQEPITNNHRVAFFQSGATVTWTSDGFSVMVKDRPPGKERRVEVEIPWPNALPVPSGAFLSVDYRLASRNR